MVAVKDVSCHLVLSTEHGTSEAATIYKLSSLASHQDRHLQSLRSAPVNRESCCIAKGIKTCAE